MSKWLIWMVMFLVLAAGPSPSGSVADDRWNVKEGFVVEKKPGKILVVRDKVQNPNMTLAQILEDAQPNAIWLSVSQADYDAVEKGDQVSIAIPDGLILESYPAQAAAHVDKLGSP
ncbi:DUF3221 domain-containing protein [Paenibacillus sp. VCA1]|uniref:DUF3221 domain-containing protein n=1 Tax=Paenibacillus sp. VCA1 TaxID=3039148 RepID=UPI00287112B6|nr:DUF3221 domain-containing protein [Paenibacillus sp. VCA1]MDR9852993.1 DUF3221 domain-containing protein [Paenibacillus sp. VCA1]